MLLLELILELKLVIIFINKIADTYSTNSLGYNDHLNPSISSLLSIIVLTKWFIQRGVYCSSFHEKTLFHYQNLLYFLMFVH